MPTLSRRASLLAKLSLLAILAAAIYVLFFRPSLQLSHFFVFQVRDLERARLAASGVPIFFGPEATGGGNLPGGFFYWLLALPLAAGGDWRTILDISILLFGAAAFVMFRSLEKVGGLATAALGSLLYVGAFGLNYAVRQNNNASFAPFFTAVAAVELILAYGIQSERSARRWWASALFIGLSVQIHYSGLILLIAAAVLQLWAKRWHLQRLGGREFAGGLAVFLLVLAPSAGGLLLQRLGWITGQGGFPPGQGSIVTALPSLVYQVASAIGATPAGTFLLLIVLMPIAPLAFAVARFVSRSPERFPEEGGRLCRAAGVVTAITFLPAAYSLFRWIGFRYSPPFEASAAFFAAVVHREAMNGALRRSYLAILAAGFAILVMGLFLFGGGETETFFAGAYFLRCLLILSAIAAVIVLAGPRPATFPMAMGLVLVLAAAFVRSPLIGKIGMESGSIAAVEVPTILPMMKLAEHIRRTTGWSFEQARERIFYVNMQEEHSLESIYATVSGEVGSSAGAEDPDGFLVAMGPALKGENFREWILAQKPLHPTLRRGLLSGAIVPGPALSFGRVWAAPYRVLKPNDYPRRFQNSGYPYAESPFESVLAGSAPGSRALSDGSFLFVWQDCDDPGCRNGIRVRLLGKEAEAEILGRGLAQPSEWTNPAATLAWRNPYVEVRCRDGKILKVVLAESIGTDPELALYVRGMASSYSVFLSPFRRRFEVPCNDTPVELGAGREAVLVITPLGTRAADPQPRTLRLP